MNVGNISNLINKYLKEKNCLKKGKILSSSLIGNRILQKLIN